MNSPLTGSFKGQRIAVTKTVSTSPYTVDGTVEALNVDATSANITVNLPATATVSGLVFTVRKVDASTHTVTVVPNGSETIEGAANVVISTQWNSVTLSNDGTRWYRTSSSSSGSGSSGTGTVNALSYFNSSSTITATNLNWDNTNSRLAINTSIGKQAALYVNGHVGIGSSGLGDVPASADPSTYASLWLANGVSLHGEDSASIQGIYLSSNLYRINNTAGWGAIDATKPVWSAGISAGSDHFRVSRTLAGGDPNSFATLFKVAGTGNVLIGTGTDDGSHKLQIDGSIKLLSGALVFPDGTIQTTAGGGGGGTGGAVSGPAGSIQFSDGTTFASDSANLFWDNTSNLLGIGTSTPLFPLHVVGNTSVMLESSGANNGIRLKSTAAGSNLKNWMMEANVTNSLFSIYTLNDAGNTVLAAPLILKRTGWVGLNFPNTTTAVSAPLHVKGATLVEGQVESTSVGFKFPDATIQKTAANISQINVRDFGAVGDGVTNDSPAFQSAIANAIAQGIRRVYVPEGQYRLNTSINLTNITTSFQIVGASRIETQIKAHCTGRPVFDTVGSLWIDISGMWIEGDATDTPSCAILQARTTGDGSSGQHCHRDLHVIGNYSVAALVSISSESNDYYSCHFENFKAGAIGVAIVQNDLWTMTSYVAVSATPVGGNTVHRFHSGIIGAGASSADTTSTIMLLEGIRGLSMNGTFLQGYGAYTVHFKGGIDSVDLSGVHEDEAVTTNGYFFDSTCTADRVSIRNFISSSPLYAATGSVVRNSHFSGGFGFTPDGYQASFDTLTTSTIDLPGLALRVRTKYEDCVRLGDSHLDSTPATSAGITRYETITDPGGSGHTIHVKHINNNLAYDDRLYTKNLQSAAIQPKPIYLSSQTGTYTPNLWNAGYYWIQAGAGDVTFANASAGPVGNSGVAQDGATLSVVFVQDSTGSRQLSWGTNYKGVDNLMPKQGPNQITTYEFRLGVGGPYHLVSHTAIDTSRMMSVKDFGAKGDGVTDDFAAIQRAFQYFSGNVSTHSPAFGNNGHLHFPRGQYLTSQTIQYVANPGCSFIVTGEGEGDGFVANATVIKYTGTTTGESRVFRIMAAWMLRFEHIMIDCNGAKYGIQSEAFTKTFPTNFAGSSHVIFRRMNIGGFRGNGAAAFLAGSTPTDFAALGGLGFQTDDYTFEECYISGPNLSFPDEDTTGYLSVAGGNTKNFRIRGGQTVAVRNIVRGMGLPSTVYVEAHYGSPVGAATSRTDSNSGNFVYNSAGGTYMVACEQESGEHTRVFFGGSAGANLNTTTIINCEYDGTPPTDGLVVNCNTGNLIMMNNKFRSFDSTTGQPTVKVRVGGGTIGGNAITAIGNYFSGAGATDWLYDGGGNNLIVDQYATSVIKPQVVALNNTGGFESTPPFLLHNIMSGITENQWSKFGNEQPAFLSTGQTVAFNGKQNSFSTKQVLDYRAFQAAAPAHAAYFGPTPDLGCRITKILVKIVTAFTGPTGPLHIKIGTSNVNGGGSNDELISATLSGTAPYYVGTNTSDWGPLLVGSAWNSPVFPTAQDILVALFSDSGNLSALTAGQMEVTITYEML
jgi:hypothetical protein